MLRLGSGAGGVLAKPWHATSPAPVRVPYVPEICSLENGSAIVHVPPVREALVSACERLEALVGARLGALVSAWEHLGGLVRA